MNVVLNNVWLLRSLMYLGCREMVHLAIDDIWQILDLPGLSLKNDFCHIFARSSILARLVDTLYTLNEAGRLPSASVHSESLSQHHSEKILVKSQSGHLDHSRIINKEVFQSRSGQLEQNRVRTTQSDKKKNVEDLSRMQPAQAHWASGLPEFSCQNLPGQLEYTRQYSGHLTRSKIASSPDRLSDPYQPGFGESTWVPGGDVGRRERDDEARSDGEERPLLADEVWGSSRCSNGLVGTSHHDQVGSQSKVCMMLKRCMKMMLNLYITLNKSQSILIRQCSLWSFSCTRVDFLSCWIAVAQLISSSLFIR